MKLKCCPFCGHKAVRNFTQISDGTGWRQGDPTVLCGTIEYDLNSKEWERCPAHPVVVGVTEDDAAQKWNTRYNFA